jgi:glycosyltransferase involved in cell wall biosynthesis
MRVIFLSEISFIEPNLSLVKRLKEKCDLYFFVEIRASMVNKFEVDSLDKDITKGLEFKELSRYDKYLPLDKTYLVRTYSNKKLVNSVKISFEIYQLVKKINPDLIVIDSHNITVFFTKLFYRNKSVLIVHDPFLHSGYSKCGLKFLRKISFSLVKKKILLNESQKEEFIKIHHYKNTDIYTSFLSEYEFMRDYPVKEKKDSTKVFQILFFGIISRYKGIEYLLEAVKDILEEGTTDINLIIAGGGDFYFDTSIYEPYNQIQIVNQYIPKEELAQLISDSSVVVCPYTDATQSGVVMTAYSLYKPVIVTAVGGLVEMVEDGKTGLVIPPMSSEELKKAILRFYDSLQLLNDMSSNIKEKYGNEYSWDVSSERFLSIFQNIIGNN